MSLREILNKHTQGIPLPNAKTSTWELDSDEEDDGYFDGVDFRTLDLSEKYALIKERQQELSDIKKEFADRRKKKREKPTGDNVEVAAVGAPEA